MLSLQSRAQASSIELTDVTPDKSLMQKIGKGGYSLSECLAELVDNSLQSFNQSLASLDPPSGVTIRVTIQPAEDMVRIEDDAQGMTHDLARTCFRLGASTWADTENGLGLYGIGLKGATMALGRSVVLITSTRGDSHYYRVRLDEQEWQHDTTAWQLPVETVPKTDRQEHGTLIEVRRLRRTHYSRQEIERLREDFGRRYAPFLKQSRLTLVVNGTSCTYQPPELLDNAMHRFEIPVATGKLVGWYGFLVRGSQILQYGFDTFRHGRLITQWDKIGFTPHPTHARLVGEIHMDHVPVQTNKRGWLQDSQEYVEAVESLARYLEEHGVLKKARQLSAQARLTRPVAARVQTYLDSIARALRSPSVLALAPGEPQASGTAAGVTRNPNGQIEKAVVTVEQRGAAENPTPPVPPGTAESARERIPKKVHEVRRIIRVGDREYRFDHDFRDLGTEADYKEWGLRDDQVLQVYTNTSFPAYFATTDLPYYAASHVAEAVAEFMCGEDATTRQVNRLKSEILRNASRIHAEL